MSRNIRKIQLPKDYAQKLLDCEIQYKLSHKPSKQIVKNLIELYTIGVEYYQSIRSHRYLYFQLKMTEIFNSVATISAINSEKTQQSESPIKRQLKSNQEQDKIKAIQIKQKQQKMLQQMAQNANQKNTVTAVKKIINDNELKRSSINQKVHKEIQVQDIKLQQKIKNRKTRKLYSKSFSEAGFTQNQTQDTLFTQNVSNQKFRSIELVPIQVNFGNVINQRQSDNQQLQGGEKQQKIERSKSSITQNISKKSQI